MYNLFFFVLAIIFGVLSVLLTGLRVYWGYTYPDSPESITDRLMGMQKVFNPLPSTILAVVCWSYVIAYSIAGK